MFSEQIYWQWPARSFLAAVLIGAGIALFLTALDDIYGINGVFRLVDLLIGGGLAGSAYIYYKRSPWLAGALVGLIYGLANTYAVNKVTQLSLPIALGAVAFAIIYGVVSGFIGGWISRALGHQGSGKRLRK